MRCLKFFIMDRKEFFKIIIKVLIYALGLIGGYIGVTAMMSCTGQRNVITRGSGRVVTVDTVYIDHNGNYQIKID